MKKTVFLRSTVRQFGRSLFILLLIGVISGYPEYVTE